MALRFTFRQLEYFVAVGDAGSIALASQRINVSSPSISSAISQLETEFGLQLFVRHHAQGLSLTPGGRQFFKAAKTILDNAAALSDITSEVSGEARGPLTFGALSTLAPLVTASVRRSFQAAFPFADVSVREGNQSDLIQMIRRAEINVALTYDLEIPNDVHFEPLATLPPIAILPADHPLARREGLSLHDLREEAYILLDLPISRDYFLSLFQREGLKPKIVERTTQMTVSQSLVANGFGFALTNMHRLSDRAPDGGKLAYVPLVGDLRPMKFGLATNQADHVSRVLSAFCEHVAQRVKAGSLPGLGVD
ncbi:MAG: LysR family transcriptional regulator [Alphaproteobacteria bacterium]|nr:LysR family transcriptional regulator [Alphaproteobacteria bacterium]